MTDSFELHQQLAADSHQLGDLPLCRLLLINDQQFPWFVLVPRVAGVKEIYQLDTSQQSAFWQESAALSQAIMSIFDGEKLNLAAIGNMVPQLHVHHVVRFQKDSCWPAPIWGKLPMVAYQTEMVAQIQDKLAAKLKHLQLIQI